MVDLILMVPNVPALAEYLIALVGCSFVALPLLPLFLPRSPPATLLPSRNLRGNASSLALALRAATAAAVGFTDPFRPPGFAAAAPAAAAPAGVVTAAGVAEAFLVGPPTGELAPPLLSIGPSMAMVVLAPPSVDLTSCAEGEMGSLRLCV